MPRFDRPGLRLADEAIRRHANTITGRPCTDTEALSDLFADLQRWAHERSLPWSQILLDSSLAFRSTLEQDRARSKPLRERIPPSDV